MRHDVADPNPLGIEAPSHYPIGYIPLGYDADDTPSETTRLLMP